MKNNLPIKNKNGFLEKIKKIINRINKSKSKGKEKKLRNNNMQEEKKFKDTLKVKELDNREYIGKQIEMGNIKISDLSDEQLNRLLEYYNEKNAKKREHLKFLLKSNNLK